MSLEILARLNPKNVRGDIGSGGIPDLTPQDIAAALGMVPAGIGRELITLAGWPDGADRGAIVGYGMALAQAELDRQYEARTRAGMAHALAKWHHPRRTPEKARMPQEWPRSALERMPAIINAVADEVAGRNLCEVCEGRGKVLQGKLMVTCTVCGGRGSTAVTDVTRAEGCGVSYTVYRERGWREVYVWLLSRMADEFHAAARSLDRALA